jgi:tRNA dimethylallyltransferase
LPRARGWRTSRRKSHAPIRGSLRSTPRANYNLGVENRVVTILGCTASSKGNLARALAKETGGEVLSVDSMKVYRGMDIGTAKPTLEQRAAVPYHLIDVADPWEAFSAARFVELADQAVAEIHARGRPVIAVGGTVLYFKCFYEGLFAGPSADSQIRAEIRARAEREGVDALHAELAQIDPEAAARIHRNDMRRIERALEVYRLTGRPISELQQQWDRDSIRRPEWGWLLIGLRREKELANRRINERTRRMIAAGFVEEARRIWSDPHGVSDQARQAVGYAELFAHFEGKLSLDRAIEEMKIHSRRLAKQQRTWLRRLSSVRWIDVEQGDDVRSVLPRVRPLLS